MGVYIDPLMQCIPNYRWRWNVVSHLTSDSLEELHIFAAALGLKRSWFQPRHVAAHYDLTPNKRREAVKLGAIELTRVQMAARMQEERKLKSQ